MKKTLFIALCALTFSACTKNNNNPQPVTPNNEPKHQLVASVTTDYGNGTYVIDYEYDAQNRVTAMHSHVTGSAYGDIADHIYEYNSAGNLAKSTITRGNDVSTFTYTYNSGVPTKVIYNLVGKPSEGHTIDITAPNNMITANATHTPSGESATVEYTYTDNNKTKELNKSFAPGGNLTFTLSFEDEYGSKKNPYLHSGSKWVLPDVQFANKNELLKETVSNIGSVIVNTYKNTYNDEGYPVTVEAVATSTGHTTNSTITYSYIDAK